MTVQLYILVPFLSHLCLCLVLVHVCVYGSVFWEIYTHPAVFGESVTLFCNTSSVQAVCEQCSKRWYGAQDLKLLSYDGLSIDPSKYETYEDSNGFALVIKHFNEEDINIQYSCTFGFFFEKKNLELKNNFEVQPTNDTTDIILNVGGGSIFDIQVHLKKVYPLPTCTIFLNGDDLSSKLITEQQQEGIFYRVTMNFQQNLQPKDCISKVQLDCTIGTRNTTIVAKNLTEVCKDDYNGEQSWTSTRDVELIVCGVTGLIMLITSIVIVVLLYRKVLKRTCRRYSRPPE